MPQTTKVHLFEIYECGDPYSRAWDASEMVDGHWDGGSVYQGNISGQYSKTGLIRYLKTNYPGCKIKDRTY